MSNYNYKRQFVEKSEYISLGESIMPNKIEQEIEQTYIVKNKRKRILWELDNPKKREYILFNRFLGIDNWKKGCLQPVEYLTSEKLSYYLAEKSKKKEVYFIGEDYIGLLPIKDAVERTRKGEWCMIYCGNGYGYFQGEGGCIKPARYLLHSSNSSE